MRPPSYPRRWSTHGALLALFCALGLAGTLSILASFGRAQQLSQTTPSESPNIHAPASGQPLPQQTPSVPLIRTSTTLVQVPVLVLNKQNQPMLELDRNDFQIYDNGVLQKITGFDDQPRPVSLAIIVDTSEPDAIGQARRSAQLITDMVLGSTGEASIFVPGPEPRQVLSFTADSTKITNVLMHLTQAPVSPQGQGDILEPLNLAMIALRHQPSDRTRAALIISRSNAHAGPGAQALLESGMSDAIPIFRISPNRPAGMPQYVNPDTPEQRGLGQGSQRVIRPSAPTNMRGQPTSNPGEANLDLGGILQAASNEATHLLAPHHMNFVYATGGRTYDPGNDHQFDQAMSLIGEELHSFYHLYYSPNNLGPTAQVHSIQVKVDLPATSNVGSTTYRHSYLGVKPR